MLWIFGFLVFLLVVSLVGSVWCGTHADQSKSQADYDFERLPVSAIMIKR